MVGKGEYNVDSMGRIVVPINDGFSDGDPNHWPRDSFHHEAYPTIYLEKLGLQWMQVREEFKEGNTYILDKLPEGYCFIIRTRRSRPDSVDKFLWGHPSGKYYFSPAKFWPHFLYLMNGGEHPCECDHCDSTRKDTKTKTREPFISSRRLARAQGAPRHAMNDLIGSAQPGPNKSRQIRRKKFLAEDRDGNQDIFKELVYNLQQEQTLDTAITEPTNMDWRAERTILRNYLTRIGLQHSFIPRLGELVLWCSDPENDELKFDEIKFHRGTQTFQMFSHKKKRFLGIPKWYAGVVTQIAEAPLVLGDAILNVNKSHAINVAGFRVHKFPDPNNPDKSLLSHHKYVPLSCTRPFSFWSIFLQGVETRDFDPSISNALTIMSSFSMLDKYHFRGEWPNASVSNEGIFLGSELLVRGDSVRLLPRDSLGRTSPEAKVTEILVIENIELRLQNCDARLDSPQICETISPRLMGKAYTLNMKAAYDPKPLTDDEVLQLFEYTGMREYGPWYRLHSPNEALEVSINQVIGRCYESEYMEVMFQDLSLGIDLEGIRCGRLFGQKTDDRIAENKEWFCGDYRLETLALDSSNGVEVGRDSESKDSVMYRAILKYLDNEAVAADYKEAKIVHKVGRSYEGLIGSRSETHFNGIGNRSSMVSTALGGDAINNTYPALDNEIDESADDLSRKIETDSDEDPLSQPKSKRLKY